MPADPGQQPFNTERWRRSAEGRLAMVRDVVETHPLQDKTLAEAVALLGPPDGTRVLTGAPWELRVDCFALMGWDVFFYGPTERYPEHAYGGSIEQIENWAYVHE